MLMILHFELSELCKPGLGHRISPKIEACFLCVHNYPWKHAV